MQKQPYSLVISAAIFIVLEIAALAMLSSSSTKQNIWLNRAAGSVNAFLWGGGEKLRQHFTLREQNEDLVRKNAELQAELQAYKLAELDAKEQAASDRLASDSRFKYTSATIIKLSRNTAHNYIIINKGWEDGIKEQSGIISDKGIVGIITAVGRNQAYGITLMNSKIRISTKVGKDGIDAPLMWDGLSSNGAVVDDIPPHYDVAAGDTVCTSGYSSLFPAGIALGTTGDSRLVDGSKKQIKVSLFQDFKTLHYVTVVENIEREEIMALEEQGAYQ